MLYLSTEILFQFLVLQYADRWFYVLLFLIWDNLETHNSVIFIQCMIIAGLIFHWIDFNIRGRGKERCLFLLIILKYEVIFWFQQNYFFFFFFLNLSFILIVFYWLQCLQFYIIINFEFQWNFKLFYQLKHSDLYRMLAVYK